MMSVRCLWRVDVCPLPMARALGREPTCTPWLPNSTNANSQIKRLSFTFCCCWLTVKMIWGDIEEYWTTVVFVWWVKAKTYCLIGYFGFVMWTAFTQLSPAHSKWVTLAPLGRGKWLAVIYIDFVLVIISHCSCLSVLLVAVFEVGALSYHLTKSVPCLLPLYWVALLTQNLVTSTEHWTYHGSYQANLLPWQLIQWPTYHFILLNHMVFQLLPW